MRAPMTALFAPMPCAPHGSVLMTVGAEPGDALVVVAVGRIAFGDLVAVVPVVLEAVVVVVHVAVLMVGTGVPVILAVVAVSLPTSMLGQGQRRRWCTPCPEGRARPGSTTVRRGLARRAAFVPRSVVPLVPDVLVKGVVLVVLL